MKRRDLLARIPMILLAVPVLKACAAEDDRTTRPPGTGGTGGDGDNGGDDPASSFRVENDDDSGHLHWFEITCVQLDSRQTTWTALGAHTHMVTLTADELDQVLAGDNVIVETTAGHPHTWILQMPAGMCG